MDVDSTASGAGFAAYPDAHDENGFDGITYTKGAAVLQMFERYIGEVPFRDGVRASRRMSGNATFGDLAKAPPSATNPNPQAFSSFIDQAGVPVVRPCAQQGAVSLSQSRWAPLENIAQGCVLVAATCLEDAERTLPHAADQDAGVGRRRQPPAEPR